MGTTINPPIEKRLPPNAQPLRFGTFEQIIDWAQRQLEPWQKATGGKAINQLVKNPLLINALSEQIRTPSDIEQSAKQATIDKPTEITNIINKIETALDKYAAGKCLLAESREAKHALNLIGKDKDLAASTLFFFQGQAFNLQKNQHIINDFDIFIRGLLETSIFRRGITADLQAERDGLNEAHKEVKQALAESREQLRSIEESHNVWDEKLGTLASEHEKGYTEQTEGVKKRLQEAETLFKEELRLRAPVEYWRKKKTAHLFTSIVAGVLFVVAIVAMLVLLKDKFGSVLSILDAVAEHSKNDKGITTASIFFLGVVPAFLVLWVLRLVSRVFLNNLALLADASERVAMTNTFLALMEEPDKVTEQDRILILQALFRPTATQGGQDEGAPPHWFDVLLNRMEPKN